MEETMHFGHQIKSISNAFEKAINHNCDAFGLTGVQAFMLTYIVLNQDKSIYPKTLEQAFHLKHPTICGILQRLAAKGFIACQADAADRRCKRIVPTEKAIDVHNNATQLLDEMDQKLIAGFTPEEAALFYSFLSRAATNIGIPWLPEKLEQQEELL